MKLSMRHLFLLVIVAFLPEWADAQTWTDLISQFGGLNPPVTDKSLSYLGQLFGTVGNVLHGSSGQLIGQMFGVFNYGIVLVAGTFVSYTVFMTAIKTSQDGSFMGREGKSAWVIVRTATGFGMLAPVFNGYSTIQVIVMWVVVHGVAFADFTWATALTYLKDAGGTVYTAPQDPSGRIGEVMSVLDNQVCMYGAEAYAKTKFKQRQESSAAPASSIPGVAQLQSAGLLPTGFYPKTCCVKNRPDCGPGKQLPYNGMCFPGIDNSGEKIEQGCGYIAFATSDPITTSAKKGTEKEIEEKANKLAAAKRKAKYQFAVTNQIVLDLASVAKGIVDGKIGKAGDLKSSITSTTLGSIVGAAADYLNIILPYSSQMSSSAQDFINNYYSLALAQGWIMAGAYYYDLSKVNREAKNAAKFTLNVATPNSSKTQKLNAGYLARYQNNLQPVADSYKDNAKMAASMVAGLDKSDMTADLSPDDGGGSKWVTIITPTKLIKSMTTSWQSDVGGNPILYLAGLGDTLMNGAIVAWGATIAVIFGLIAAISAGSSVNPLPFAGQAATAFLVPVLTGIVGALFVSGATLAIYVPLIPYILFVFGAIGWLIFVVEAMIAAPLVALGVTHPEGHDFMGKSEQSMMILLSVFLRPVLMVMGLLTGMVLSFVALRVLNSGFFYMASNVLRLGGGLALPFIFVAVIVVYVSLVVSLVNQAYSLIYVIPDRVMRWIGGPQDQTGIGKEALQAAGGAVKEAGGTLSKGMEGGIGGAKGAMDSAYGRQRSGADAEKQSGVKTEEKGGGKGKN